MTVTDLDLDAIEARANAASDGPWIVVHEPAWEADDVQHPDVIKVGAPLYVGDDEPFTVCLVSTDYEDDPVDVLGDAEFIAHARTDVPALVAALREARAEVERISVSLGGMVEWLAEIVVDTRDALRAGGCAEHFLTAEQVGALEAATRILARERNADPSRYDLAIRERDDARAAIARVRALCEPKVGRPFGLDPATVLAALDVRHDPSATTTIPIDVAREHAWLANYALEMLVDTGDGTYHPIADALAKVRDLLDPSATTEGGAS